MATSGRSRLIFLHIPKTAGLTLRHLLIGRYPPDEVWAFDGPERRVQRGEVPPNANVGDFDNRVVRAIRRQQPPLQRFSAARGVSKTVREFNQMPPEVRDRIKLVYGHLWFGVHAYMGEGWRYFTMLRDPVERSLSLYAHRVNVHGLQDDIVSYFRDRRDIHQYNHQTFRLSGLQVDRSLTPADGREMLERAKENLQQHFITFGLTERFDESLLLLRQKMGYDDVRYKVHNVSKDRHQRDELPPGLLDTIIDENELDLELYEFGRTMFEQHLAQANIGSAELAAFKVALKSSPRQARNGAITLTARVRRRLAPAALWTLRHSPDKLRGFLLRNARLNRLYLQRR